jgi:DNA-binding beta-propeller fold protein YncE
MDVYAMDRGFALVAHQSLPTGGGTRGVAVDPRGHSLFLSYGPDGGSGGELLKYDLVANQVVWSRSYPHGIDSFALTPDGTTIYMPDGELTDDGRWYEVRASDGSETGKVIDTGVGTGDNGPHNTVVSLDGRYVYLGDRNYYGTSSRGNQFYQYDRTSGNLKAIGPFRSGIRPFTVNRANTLAYTAITGFLGFQVGDLNPGSPTYGRVLATVPIARPAGASCPNGGASTPSHGVSFAPDEAELYVLDFPCNLVHVFDVRGAHARAPVQVADIAVTPFNLQEHPCAYDCLGDGWLLHSLDGKYVMVGDSGDVLSTATRSRVATLDALHNSRKFIEIDWRGGLPIATTTRHGLGRA